MASESFDVIIVGAGFGGVFLLYQLRKLGYNCRLLEANSTLGGVWSCNSYPGARVDTNVPAYEFSLPEAYEKFVWNELYPARDELTRYFKHLDKVLDISKDTNFKTWIHEAKWNDTEGKWHIKGSNDTHLSATYFLPCVGFASKRYIPYMKNLDSFKGPCHHTADWPLEGIDLVGKKVAVIGTGASGVQVIQEIGPVVKSMTVFQRTPNFALPMQQKQLTTADQDKSTYPDIYKHRLTTFSGLLMNVIPDKTFDFTLEENHKYFDQLYEDGGFSFWLRAYGDLNLDRKANDVAYNYWRDQTRKRINDPALAELLAPEKSPHAFGTKRPSLEMTYWEVFNQDNVDVVPLKVNPIIVITETGIKTQDKEFEFDVIVLATGFDAVTGGLTQIDIIGKDGKTMRDQWAKVGAKTYFGMAVPNFPNCAFTYGPQAPTAFGNGPPTIELQGEWIINTLEYMRKNNLKVFNPTKESADEWTAVVDGIYNCTLFPETDGWYNGGNIVGKVKQSLMYLGGLPSYRTITNEAAAKGYVGLETY